MTSPVQSYEGIVTCDTSTKFSTQLEAELVSPECSALRTCVDKGANHRDGLKCASFRAIPE